MFMLIMRLLTNPSTLIKRIFRLLDLVVCAWRPKGLMILRIAHTEVSC
jgi:hypothetical protein